MRIGIDGIILRGRDAGSLRYFELLLESLAQPEQKLSIKTSQQQSHMDYNYVVFANRRVLQTAALPKMVSSSSPSKFSYQEVAAHPFLPNALRQQTYHHWHKSGNLDLLHTPVFVPPLLYSGKTIMTLFDLTFLLHPKTQKWTGRLWWRLLGEKGIKKAERIITISESTRNDLCRYLKVPSEKVDVIYPFVPAHFHPLVRGIDDNQQRAIANKYGLPEKYILFVSTLERRKNILTLLHAFGLAKRQSALKHQLVLVGQPGWLYEDIFKTIETLGLGDQVVLLGYVPEADLPGIYQAADLFVYLSYYEGFGLPVLEAMACGVPVLSSNSSSLPEVLGKAGVMVPAEDIERAAFEIQHILSDRDLRHDLTQRGIQQARTFSRDRFREEMLAVYTTVLSNSAVLSQPASPPTPELNPSAEKRARHPVSFLSYNHPEGVQERKDLSYPALSTSQNGLILLDRLMIQLWHKAHGQNLPEIISWAQSQGLPSRETCAALACLAEAGLLLRQGNDSTSANLRLQTSLLFSENRVSAIIVNYNSLNWLETCLSSLDAQTHYAFEIIIVDNASSDDSVAWLETHHPEIRLIKIDRGMPLSQALNLGIRAAQGDYYLLLNPDIHLDPNAIAQMLAVAHKDMRCAAVAAKLKFLWAPAFLNGLGNYVGMFSWGTDSAIGHLDLGQFDAWSEIPSACFAAALLPAQAFSAVGPIDEGFPMYYEDSEWCYRARLLGYSVRAAPQAVVYHALGRRIPTGFDNGLSSAKLRQVVYGRLRFATRIAGRGLIIRLFIGYFFDDIIQFCFALSRGKWDHLQAYLMAWRDYFKTLPTLRTERKLIQRQRKITDRALLETQMGMPMPHILHGIPQLTWDLIQNDYLPLLATQQNPSIPELQDSNQDSLNQHPASLLQRARQIQRVEGFSALFYRVARYLQWLFNQP
jgi:GT2 family glycosyltransferase/glycosyltransferase involved in cell wall biosynthesis